MILFKRIFSVFISLFLFSPFVANKTEKYAPVDNENLILSAVVLSDMHVESNNTERFGWVGNTLNGVYATDRTPDVLAFAGDNTMNGQDIEWFDFYGFVNRFNKNGKTVVAFGNHDFGNNDSQKTYNKLSKRSIFAYNTYLSGNKIDNVYYSTEVKGYKFIALGSEKNAEYTVSVISEKQLEWLKGELKEAADKNMPAFVINHNMVMEKNGLLSYFYSNMVEQSKELAEILESCGTKVVYFSGHAHEPLNADSVDTVGNCTYVNLPCAGSLGSYSLNESGKNSFGTGCVTEVYKDSIVLRFRCFGENRWIDNYDNITIDLK